MYAQKRATMCMIALYLVNSTGEMSNFLIEDNEAVMKFMDAEKQKKKFKL